MDLENFNNLDENPPDASQASDFSAEEALEYVDREWYRPATRRARWMDLLGDYAGSEPFVIDGESLLQVVLDDPLLAIARDGEPSFQILHAYHILERALLKFTERSAKIDIVFWRANSHATLQTGGTPFLVFSRLLARTLLSKHILKLGLPVYMFEDLHDPLWLRYEVTRKPMFVLINDGGVLDNHPKRLSTEKVLMQRIFVFDLLSRGLPIALLKGAEYRDSKILSFVFEQVRDSHSQATFPESLHVILDKTTSSLDDDLRAIEELLLPDRMPDALDEYCTSILEIARSFIAADRSSSSIELLYIFVIHCLLLRQLSVQERARSYECLSSSLSTIVVRDFLPMVFVIANVVISKISVTPEMDGRIYCSLIRFIILHYSEELPSSIGQPAFISVQNIWSKLGLAPVNLKAFSKRFPQRELPASARPVAALPFRLLPFENDVFNAELSLVRVPVHDTDDAKPSTRLDFGPGTLFSDTQHWHNKKAILSSHMGGAPSNPVDERAQRRILKRNQRFMATMQVQAGTLTGASGGSLQQIVIAPVGSTKIAPKPQRVPPIKIPKQLKISSADKLRQKIAKEKTAQNTNESELWWREQLSLMSKLSTSQKVEQLKALLRNKRAAERLTGGEMRLYSIHLQLLSWVGERDPDSAPIRDDYTVCIMRIIKDMGDRRLITSTIAAALSAVLQSLGFGDYATSLLDTTEPDAALNFKFIKLLRSKTKASHHQFMHITEHPVVWQLRLFGEYMDRSMESSPDSRVSFEPDAWQREVLDCIDANNSLLVVAPTSAGKTFISFYAMEKVLRGSDDGILVYIAPTKALVTQIAAEIYARFSKNLSGKSCWAIHTRDYRINDPQKCQILVTVPEMLSIMLLSPPLARVWTSRIKSIILDEIHSIGQQEGGAVWEQIILLAPCPIIGLSATIGSPDRFNSWLESVQEAHGYSHKFIQYPHRYSHLRKFFYNLTENPKAHFAGLATHTPSERSRFLHPISLLDFGVRSLPTDLALEARDTLSLYEALAAYEGAGEYDVAKLEPIVFFASTPGMLRQKDILLYESKLKAIISTLITLFDAQAPSSLHHVIRRLEDPTLASAGTLLHAAPSRDMFRSNLIYLLADLNSRGELPAILFNFDRSDCEHMAQSILASLETAEETWRSNSPEWQRKLQDWESWKLRSKQRERLAERAQRQKKDDDAEPSSSVNSSWESSFNPDDPSPEFSFVGGHTSYSKADIEGEIRDLHRWTSTQSWALDALKRGIAVHHSGMNKRYRSLVESLFRLGFVRVVIATGTLALGINAPTKTSIFCGDSPYLTALQYRQCAGRAGRRGYDLLGNVVFYGMSLERVKRLVLSKLPSLGGNFPMTSTLTIRLLNLLEGSNYAPVAVNAVKSMMALPHISFGSDTGKQQLLHHLRFSIEFLRRSRLLDRKGKPMNLFAIAAHLYYTEPSNFALVALFQDGVLHDICEEPSIITAQNDFIMLMAHLFGRRYLSRVYAEKKHLAALAKKYPSMIVLPPLPKFAHKVLTTRAEDILHVFVNYAVTYATEYKVTLGPDDTLPLSKTDYSDRNPHSNPLPTFRRYLQETAIPVVARSSFAATSGHGDKFRTVEELVDSARDGLHLNGHAIPSLDKFLASDNPDENEHSLNAYLYDFYIHGQVSSLAAANGIRKGDVWYLLQDFMLTLMTIKSALEQLLTKASKEACSMNTAGEAGEVDLDSGYGTFDPAETEDSGADDEIKKIKRPLEVTDADWQVYKVVSGATAEFDKKYKAMWA
ncbi:hypothetical protein FPV67DRAFT_1415532 [Lyophyllum atratum]|nr:hypothetical protein FPV67DRAFT_1415532 [Lyophyllum atratum]